MSELTQAQIDEALILAIQKDGARIAELEAQRDELVAVKAEENAIWNAAFNVQAGQIAKLIAERDELLAVFSLVIDEIEKRDRGNGNAPGHAHDVPGVWDSDNGALAGKPCAWCATWNKAKELRASIASVKANHA